MIPPTCNPDRSPMPGPNPNRIKSNRPSLTHGHTHRRRRSGTSSPRARRRRYIFWGGICSTLTWGMEQCTHGACITSRSRSVDRSILSDKNRPCTTKRTQHSGTPTPCSCGGRASSSFYSSGWRSRSSTASSSFCSEGATPARSGRCSGACARTDTKPKTETNPSLSVCAWCGGEGAPDYTTRRMSTHPNPPHAHTHTHARHECTSRRYGDNIGGRNFESVLSYGPIDVVYTWVNGSDPRWLARKRAFERWVFCGCVCVLVVVGGGWGLGGED